MERRVLVKYTVKNRAGEWEVTQERSIGASDLCDTVGKRQAIGRGTGTSCMYFERRGGCRQGNQCTFLHVRPGLPPDSTPTPPRVAVEPVPVPPTSPFLKLFPTTTSTVFTASVDEDFSYEDNAVPKDLECAICMSAWVHPLELDCGHIFCRGCLEGMTSLACSVCRGVTRSTRVPNRALVNLVNALPVKCLKTMCKWTGPREEYTNHKCYRPVFDIVNQGNHLFANKDFQGALEKYTAALALDPTKISLLLNRSVTYERLQMLKEAFEDAKAVVRIDDKSPLGHQRLAMVSVASEHWREAMLSFEKMLTLIPSGQAQDIERTMKNIEHCRAKIAAQSAPRPQQQQQQQPQGEKPFAWYDRVPPKDWYNFFAMSFMLRSHDILETLNTPTGPYSGSLEQAHREFDMFLKAARRNGALPNANTGWSDGTATTVASELIKFTVDESDVREAFGSNAPSVMRATATAVEGPVRNYLNGRYGFAAPPQSQPQPPPQQPSRSSTHRSPAFDCIREGAQRNVYLCSVCDTVITGGFNNVEQHVAGSKHRSKLTR